MGHRKGAWKEAAHAAARAVDTQASHCPCLCPANNLIYEFLLEVRRQLMEKAAAQAAPDGSFGGADPTTFASALKKAANELRDHPHRVWDMASAQRVKFIAERLAKLIDEELFSLYPPHPPEEEELLALAQEQAAKKAAAAAQRKRKKEEAAAAASGAGLGLAGTAFLPAAAPPPRAAAGGRGGAAASAGAGARSAQPAGVAAEDEDEEGGGRGGKRAKRERAKKEYIPQLRSANWTFLIVMLQAQKGPLKQQHFGKTELMDLAEASGLSNKPIKGDGTAVRRGPDGKQYAYDGWSGFKQLETEGLAHRWSNPVKVSLTQDGFALAERLYRDGVGRGVLQPIPGIPIAGPMLFQPEAPDPAALAAAAAGVPLGALPSAGLQAGRQAPPQQARQQQSAAATEPWQHLPPPLAAARPGGAASAGRKAGGRGRSKYQPLLGYGSEGEEEEEEEPAPLAARLQQRHQPGQAKRPRAPAGAGLAAAARPVSPEGVIDLLSDEEGPAVVRGNAGRPAAAGGGILGGTAAAAAAALAAAAGPPVVAVPAAAPVPPVLAVPDEQVAAMMGMGYSDKKARRALRQSLGETGLPDIGRAVELAEFIVSDDEGDSDLEAEPAAASLQPARAGGQLEAPAAAAGAARPPASAAAAAAAAAAARWEALGGRQQQQQEAPRIQQQVPPAAARPPVRPASLAAAPRQQQQTGAPPLVRAGAGHIRSGSLQASQERGPSLLGDGSGSLAGAGITQQGGGAAGSLARSGSASGGLPAAAGAPGTSIRVPPGEVRLPPLPAGRQFGQEYEVVLLIDQREQFGRERGQGRNSALSQHVTQMRQSGLMVEERHLPIGDAVWIARSRFDPAQEFVLDHIMERKGCDDLVKSIMDDNKRYLRQKYYLKRCGVRTIYYLLEGDPDMLPNEQQQKAVRTAAANIEVIDGFTVLRTTNPQDTFRLFLRLTNTIKTRYQNLAHGPGSSGAGAGRQLLPGFEAWAAQCKANSSGALTLHDVWGMMLAAVPTLGPEAAHAILQHYPTPLHLHRAYQAAVQADGHRAAERLLADLKAAGGTQAVGPARAAKVYRCLFRGRLVARGGPAPEDADGGDEEACIL